MSSLAHQADIKFTYQDYLLLPEEKRYELIEGDLHMTPSPITVHQRISWKLGYYLGEYVLNNQLGEILSAPMDVVFSDEDVVQPDILFVSNERKEIIKTENIHGAPDLVIEILSPSTSNRDLIIKRKLYAKFGVLEYWIVNPENQTVEVMTWAEKGFKTIQVYPKNSKLHSPILSGLELSLGKIFL